MSETVGTRVRQRLGALGLSIRGAAAAAGIPESTIRNILIGTSESPRGTTLTKLAAVLQVSEVWLNTGVEAAPSPSDAPRASEVRRAGVTPPTGIGLPKDIAVRGTAAGSEIGRGAFQLSSDVIDYVRRPDGLAGAKDAYALYVEGDSMSPRFEPGDLVFVHPHRKALVGDYIIIQEPDTDNGEPRAFIKRLKKVTGTTLVVEQFNPASTITFMLRPGTVWHKVITDGELYGI